MAQQTAVDYLIQQLQAPCRGIPSHIIEQAKQMEKEQIMKDYEAGIEESNIRINAAMNMGLWRDVNSEQYYNKTYKSE